MLTSVFALTFCLEPKRTYSVLPWCKYNLLSISYDLTDLRPVVNAFLTDALSLPDTEFVESSAYRKSLFLRHQPYRLHILNTTASLED